MSRYATELEACRAWVAQWDNIPSALVEKAYQDSPDEVELLAGGDKVSDCCDAEVETQVVHTDDGLREVVCCTMCHQRLDRHVDNDGIVREGGSHWSGSMHGWPAAWGTLFHPGETLDEDWIRSNPEIVATCGFLVYDCDEAGILLGIDGAGYDFYASHWIPLYRARGLQWHKPVENLPKRKVPSKKGTAGAIAKKHAAAKKHARARRASITEKHAAAKKHAHAKRASTSAT